MEMGIFTKEPGHWGVEMDWDYIERHKSGATIFE